jgi:hypothetical protein
MYENYLDPLTRDSDVYAFADVDFVHVEFPRLCQPLESPGDFLSREYRTCRNTPGHQEWLTT